MRLIDADALKEKLIKERDAIPITKTERYGFGVEFPDPHGMSMHGGINKAFRCMEQTPTIDAVPVVRCKDCANYRGIDGVAGSGYCLHWEYEPHTPPNEVYEDDFCSYGERKSDG